MAETISGFPEQIGFAVIPGGAVGDHSVPGNLEAGDNLISVIHVSGDLVTNTDLTAEFSIKAAVANTITNTTTDTTGDFLLVTWAEGTQEG